MRADAGGDGEAERSSGDTPPGWTTNPSTWRQRLPIIGLALMGTGIAGYLGPSSWD